MRKLISVAVLALAISGCASSYGPETITGGYDDKQVNEDTFVVFFGGNGYTSRETVQTFWLYHAAELTLAHGFDGFEIMTPVKLVNFQAPGGSATLVPVQYVEKPWIRATIHLLRKPAFFAPPRSFDAAQLKAVLEPRVKGTLCSGNVCPHFHSYLMPALPS